MEEAPKVSVIIPVYNTEQYLRQCLDTVVNQTLREIEIICVDDASTHGSRAILQEFVQQDSRFKVFHQENQGQGKARNNGLYQGEGKFVVFLDSGDWFEPVFLQEMVQEGGRTGADITICSSDEFDVNTNRFGDGSWMLKSEMVPKDAFSPLEIADSLFQFTYGWPWDKLYRAEFIQQEHFLFPDLPNSEDLVFVFTSLAAASKITIVQEVEVHHRMSRASSVSNSRCRAPEATYQAVAKLRERLYQMGNYYPFEKSFQIWAIDFLIWNAANMGCRSVQETYVKRLKKEWLPGMGLNKCSASLFPNWFLYGKYLLLRFAPWPVFSFVVSAYHKSKRREEKM